MGFNTNGTDFNLDLENSQSSTESNALVSTGGKLPHCFQIPTSKLLDVIVAVAPACRKLDARGKKQARQTLNQKLYNKTRPGFYLEINEILHLGYAGQPHGHGTQHQWRIFCGDSLRVQIETLIKGTL